MLLNTINAVKKYNKKTKFVFFSTSEVYSPAIKEKIKLIEEKGKKPAMTKEVTKSMMMELKDLPNEILVKIFNFLPSDSQIVGCFEN